MERMKLSCRAMGMNCGFEVHADAESEVTTAIADHFRRIHNLEFTEEMRAKARDLIRFVEA